MHLALFLSSCFPNPMCTWEIYRFYFLYYDIFPYLIAKCSLLVAWCQNEFIRMYHFPKFSFRIRQWNMKTWSGIYIMKLNCVTYPNHFRCIIYSICCEGTHKTSLQGMLGCGNYSRFMWKFDYCCEIPAFQKDLNCKSPFSNLMKHQNVLHWSSRNYNLTCVRLKVCYVCASHASSI